VKNSPIKDLINYDEKDYLWHCKDVGIWIDMNEPACFEVTDKTMPKSNIHSVELVGDIVDENVEHRNVHSLYGFYSNKRTFDALCERNDERPFILSRSFYPGAQRFSAIWSGDSSSDWWNFETCVPILLQKSTSGIYFIGGDVPGFYNNPLLTEE
jgi:alpha 1,3-glucosidase